MTTRLSGRKGNSEEDVRQKWGTAWDGRRALVPLNATKPVLYQEVSFFLVSHPWNVCPFPYHRNRNISRCKGLQDISKDMSLHLYLT